MHSQVIPSFGDKAQLRMAEGCLCREKPEQLGRGGWTKESVQRQPFPADHFRERDRGWFRIWTRPPSPTSAGHSQEDSDAKEPGFYPTKWAVQDVPRGIGETLFILVHVFW